MSDIKKQLVSVNIILVCFFVFAPLAISQMSKPTLVETLNFIKRRIKTDAGTVKIHPLNDYHYVDTTVYTVRILRPKIIEVSETRTHTATSVTSAKRFTHVALIRSIVNLADIDSGRIRVEKNSSGVEFEKFFPATYEFSLCTSDNKDNIKFFTKESGVNKLGDVEVKNMYNPNGYSNRVQIEFKDKGIAERVAKAFIHAVKLSGGVSDPF